MRQNWDRVLQIVIGEAYDLDVKDKDDENAMVVLIALHDAIKGVCDLHELAELCVNHARGVKMKPVIAEIKARIWVPPAARIIN
jgi:hypothetical protein